MSELKQNQREQLQAAIDAGLFRRINKVLYEEGILNVQVESITFESTSRENKREILNIDDTSKAFNNLDINQLNAFELAYPVCRHGLKGKVLCTGSVCRVVCNHT